MAYGLQEYPQSPKVAKEVDAGFQQLLQQFTTMWNQKKEDGADGLSKVSKRCSWPVPNPESETSTALVQVILMPIAVVLLAAMLGLLPVLFL